MPATATKPITASQLRADVYRLLDRTLKTGTPLEIIRGGKKLRLTPEVKPSKFANLTRKKCITGSYDDYVHIDWSGEWKP